MSEPASREIQRSHVVISIQGEFSVQKTSECTVLLSAMVKTLLHFKQGLTSLQRRVQGDHGQSAASKHVLFLMICVGCSRTKASLIISFFSV